MNYTNIYTVHGFNLKYTRYLEQEPSWDLKFTTNSKIQIQNFKKFKKLQKIWFILQFKFCVQIFTSQSNNKNILTHTSIQIFCSNFYITVEQQKYFILYTVYILFCNSVSITMVLTSDPRLQNKIISSRYHTAELQLELKLLSTVSSAYDPVR